MLKFSVVQNFIFMASFDKSQWYVLTFVAAQSQMPHLCIIACRIGDHQKKIFVYYTSEIVFMIFLIIPYS